MHQDRNNPKESYNNREDGFFVVVGVVGGVVAVVDVVVGVSVSGDAIFERGREETDD